MKIFCIRYRFFAVKAGNRKPLILQDTRSNRINFINVCMGRIGSGDKSAIPGSRFINLVLRVYLDHLLHKVCKMDRR